LNARTSSDETAGWSVSPGRPTPPSVKNTGQHGTRVPADAGGARHQTVGGVRAIRSSTSRRNRWAAMANRPYSTNEPGSTKSATFSRAVRPCVACLRSTASGRAASSVSALRLTNSAWSSRMASPRGSITAGRPSVGSRR
jgi:hypothetical protein